MHYSKIGPVYYLKFSNFVAIIVTMTIWTPELSTDIKHKYEAIAAAIGEGIANGTLRPGQKLPTQRELSKRLSVTIGTVGRAYAVAEQRGLISLEVGRGSFVRAFDSARHEMGDGQNIVDLGLNLPPVTEHRELLARTLAQIANSRDVVSLFGNAPVESFEQHRIAAAKWLHDRIDCSPGEVLICSGTQNALIASLATLCRPRDRVLVEELTFPGMLAAAKLLHLELVPVPMDEQGLIPSELERAARKAGVLYCIPTNQNPTTITMPPDRRQKIAGIAADRNLYVIEDDVYGKLLENAPAPIATLAPERTFLISSLAKTLSVGLRLAFVRVPDDFREPMKIKMRASNFFPAPLLSEIAAKWIHDGIASTLLTEQRQAARQRQQIAREFFNRQFIPGDPAGHHLWLKLPDAWSAETLERAAKENGINVYSAASFTVNNMSTPNAIRIALGAARNESELRSALGVIARLLKERTEPGLVRY
jgi:DNA-binding transcriptional MocR family regulator